MRTYLALSLLKSYSLTQIAITSGRKSRQSLAALSRDINWRKLWDVAREHGIQGAWSISAVLRAISMPVFSKDLSCHICDFSYHEGSTPLAHISEFHLDCDINHLLDLLRDPCDDTFIVAASFKSTFSQHHWI